MVISASMDDVGAIYQLIDYYNRTQITLARSKENICRDIQNFFVVVDDEKKDRLNDSGQVLACSSFYIYNKELVEIRSLCVDKDHHRKGYGRALVEHQINTAQRLKIKQLFTLTAEVAFFEKLGFSKVDKAVLPDKIFKDCQYCDLVDDCRETALVYPL